MCEFTRKTRDSGHTVNRTVCSIIDGVVRRRRTQSLSEEAAGPGQRGGEGLPRWGSSLHSTELKGGNGSGWQTPEGAH